MEYLQLFDEKGNMLNEKIARENQKNIETGKYFMIILLIIENDQNEYLMQLTSKEKGHVYALTGGHVQYGDDGLKTCIKETKEELGLELKKEDISYLGLIKGKAVLVSVYYTNINIDLDKLKLQDSEVESTCWMSMNKIDELINKDQIRNTNISAFKMFKEFKNKSFYHK